MSRYFIQHESRFDVNKGIVVYLVENIFAELEKLTDYLNLDEEYMRRVGILLTR